jgi:hypothetical protein
VNSAQSPSARQCWLSSACFHPFPWAFRAPLKRYTAVCCGICYIVFEMVAVNELHKGTSTESGVHQENATTKFDVDRLHRLQGPYSLIRVHR